MAYNTKMFPNRFDGDIEAAFAAAEEARIKADKLSKTSSGTGTNRPTSRRNRTRISRTSTKEPETITTTKEETNNDESQEAKKELSPEEIERRRKKNAKKRAKQKAKKAAQKQQEAEENADEEGT